VSDLLKLGDRVRVTDRNRVQGYQPDAKGLVQAMPNMPAIGDQFHDVVAMDNRQGLRGSPRRFVPTICADTP
jgi:hypothetical protein